LVNLLLLVPLSLRVQGFLAHSPLNKSNHLHLEAEPRPPRVLAGLAHQLQTRLQQHRQQRVGLGEEYLVNNHSNSNNSHSNNSNQLLVDLEQRSNHNSRVEDCLETRSAILRLSQPVSQRLVVSDVILPHLITH
jgi:hypothetical protein